ncbi:DinB family protein [Brachybacterium rhamnosum]|uniref:DinB family protein n=1 Tax=Brachybacterium rhamnosum TaxID=173361 RepID=A0ABW4PZ78_9MICO
MSTIENSREFTGARFLRTSFRGATLRGCDISDVTVRGTELNGLDLDSHDLALGTLLVNGVDVVPFVEAELDRLFPGRALSRSRTPDGLREGWAAVQDAWQATLEATPPELVDAHVPDEWSLAQTLRHLILATDAWLGGGILGEEQPFHEIGLLFTGASEMGVGTSMFRADTPSFEEILAVRAEHQRRVTRFLESVSPAQLDEERADPWGSTLWRPTVGDCLRTILEEEWAHLRYVRRDLALLS